VTCGVALGVARDSVAQVGQEERCAGLPTQPIKGCSEGQSWSEVNPDDAPAGLFCQLGADANAGAFSAGACRLELDVPHQRLVFENEIVSRTVNLSVEHFHLVGASLPEIAKNLADELMLEHTLTVGGEQ